MGSGADEAADDKVAFGHHLFDDPAEVGKTGPHAMEYLFETLPVLPALAGERIGADEVGSDEVVGTIEAALVDDLFDKGADDAFVSDDVSPPLFTACAS